MNIIKVLFEITSWIFLVVIVFVVIFSIGSSSNMLGGYKSFLIQSGSMEPSIMTGDIIIIHQTGQYEKNDVITFQNEESRIITHRVIEINNKGGDMFFVTKGDANRSEDEGVVSQTSILGKVIYVIPKLGFLVAFSKSLPGLIILIAIPALALIIGEVLKIVKKN